MTRPFASVFPDGRWCGVTTDLAETTARIASLSARDGETWGRLVAGFGNEASHLFGLLGSPMKFRALAYFMLKTLRAKGIGGTLDMGRFLMQTPRQWLEQTFKYTEVRAMLGAWGMHLDFAPDVAGGALFPYLEGMAGQAFGMALGEAARTRSSRRWSQPFRRAAGWWNAMLLLPASCAMLDVQRGSNWPTVAGSTRNAR